MTDLIELGETSTAPYSNLMMLGTIITGIAALLLKSKFLAIATVWLFLGWLIVLLMGIGGNDDQGD